MEELLLALSILLEGVGPLLVIWFFVFIVTSVLKGEKAIVRKFHLTFGITLLWCTAIYLFIEIYMILVDILIKHCFLVKKPISDYSTPIFYIVLLMFLGMLLMTFKKLGIFKDLFIFRDLKKVSLNSVIKYTIIGSLFGISYGSIICALYIYFALIIGISALGMHPMYGDNFLLFFGIGLVITEILLGTLTGVKEGIRYGLQK